MTKRINNTTLSTAVALGLILGTAGGLTAISVPLTAIDAHAFGLGDITGGIKKVGGAIKDGAKKGVSAVNETRKAVKKVVDTGQDAIRDATHKAAGQAAYGFAREVDKLQQKARGKYDPEKFQKDWEDFDEEVDGFVDFANTYDRAKNRVKGAVKDAPRKAREKALTGSLKPVPPRNQRFQPGQWGQNGKAQITLHKGKPTGKSTFPLVQKGTKAPVQGITLEKSKPGAGLKSQISLQKGTKAPVQGITRENLKPAKGQAPKVTLQKGQLGNDRSAQGRPVGKANTKTVRKGTSRNVPGHRGSRTPEARQRNYPNYPPKRDYPDYPGKKDASSVTKQGNRLQNRSLPGRPVGGRKPIGNDRSLAGRPVGGRKPIGQDRSNMGRPAGITKQNLQPQRKKTRMMRDNGKSTRDLSRNKGRNKRNGRNTQNQRQDFKAQMKRNNNKRNLRIRGRGNRRG